MSEIVKQRKWFWAWQDEKEEAWLGEMAQSGYHLIKVGWFGNYLFEKGQPKNAFYRMDYRDASQDQEHYVQIFADAGWEHIGEMVGWQYFRKEASPGETPEIFSDVESKIQKYRRQEVLMLSMIPIFLMLFIVFDWDFDSKLELGVNIFSMLSFFAAIAYFGVSYYKLEERIKQIRSL